MGQFKHLAFFVAILLLLTTALVINIQPKGAVQVKERSLTAALATINHWSAKSVIPLQDEVVDALDLDDYLYRNYSNGVDDISLYIGYYLTGGKVGAAHDPLVCLPGQGWLVKQRGSGKLDTGVGADHKLSYSTMVVERNSEQELFLYWFQTYDKAVSGTFAQKLTSLTNKVQGLGQDNAFVRLSCSMNGRTEQQCKQILFEFTRDFYPAFINYIKN